MLPDTGRRRTATVAILAAIVVGLSGAPAVAGPGPGDEGGTPTLGQVLEQANREYLDAQARLEASQKRQVDLAAQATAVEAELGPLTEQSAALAAAAYRSGRLRTASALLDGSAGSFLDGAGMLDAMARRNDRQLRRLNQMRRELAETRAAIDAEIATQQQQAALMLKKKQDAEKALAAVGGRATGGFVSATSPLARPAPRRADGSWAPESCIIDDPTTGGCLTPRTLHALQQARTAGFTRYVSCYRGGDRYEHPKGRACDFAASAGGYGGVATGADRVYGNNLAAYFVRNAGALGVLYVIWYEQIWQPTTGWRSYNSGRGDPSSDHTNHVHLSIY